MSEILTVPTTPTISIEAKQFGRGPALFPKWEMELPTEPLTLREFLTRVVQHEVAAYQERQEGRKTLQILTERQIAEGAAAGKIDMGGRSETDITVNLEDAVAQAIQAFTDGIYYVFVDDNQQEDLDGVLTLRQGSRVMFLRLVALAGG